MENNIALFIDDRFETELLFRRYQNSVDSCEIMYMLLQILIA